jgi:hypothetical protein
LNFGTERLSKLASVNGGTLMEGGVANGSLSPTQQSQFVGRDGVFNHEAAR